MKKNAFTLIELLAVLIIMMLLITISIPLVSNVLKESRQKATNALIKNIEVATKKYVTDNIRDMDELNRFGFINISIKTLVEKKYIQSNLKNPNTKEIIFLDDIVYVTLDYNNKLDVVYDIEQSAKAKITLKGFLNDKVKKGTTYTDPGAIGFDGINTDNHILSTSTVDTSEEGVYTLEYSYKNSNVIYRYVIVTDDI